VLYDVDEEARCVEVVAVGEKPGIYEGLGIDERAAERENSDDHESNGSRIDGAFGRTADAGATDPEAH
jgi:hypothetical protein